jgi:hypothetical protein
MLGTVIAMAFVLGVVGVVVYTLFKLSPFAHHEDHYHEPGKRQQSPRLD